MLRQDEDGSISALGRSMDDALDEAFGEVGLTAELLTFLIEEHETLALPEYDRFWMYYRNPQTQVEVRDGNTLRTAWRAAQAEGLPGRLRGAQEAGGALREAVIENDIGWRVNTLVEYMAGRRVGVVSRCERASEERRSEIEAVATAILEANGGLQWVHDLALLGSVYGHVDVIVRGEGIEKNRHAGGRGNLAALASKTDTDGPAGALREEALAQARNIRLETVEAPRSIPLLSPHDYRKLNAYVLRYTRYTNEVERARGTFLSRLAGWMGNGQDTHAGATRGRVVVTEIFSANRRQVYEDDRLALDERHGLGVIPAVHIQNQSQPYYWEGVGEVEGLIALQDELNTRLSDRANRVTLQSFKMYLGKGIEGFGDKPIAPGQMWMTDNADASIEAFGGDSESPSEEAHIREIREALDKASAVSALAAGNLPARVGALSSENAMRISLLGILSKVERKRRLYGAGIAQALALGLAMLDKAGVFATTEAERALAISWGSAIPFDADSQADAAQAMRGLGVPADEAREAAGVGGRSVG